MLDTRVQLYNGNCLDIMRQMHDCSIDLCVTDPPYKTITGGRNDSQATVRPKGVLLGNKKLFTHQTDVKIAEWMPEIYRVLKAGTQCYIFTNTLNMSTMLSESERVGFKLHNILVWEKNNCTPSQYYMKNCEYVLFLYKGKAKWINNIGASKTVHQYNNISGTKSHPTEKPTSLLCFYIENSSEPAETVFDPFMGTGATGVACIETDRRFIGVELDPQYYATAERRMQASEDRESTHTPVSAVEDWIECAL